MNHVVAAIHGHVSTHVFEDDGLFPNNPKFPVLIYKGALFLHPDDEADCIVELFKRNNWSNGWKDTVYNYDHYHSNAQEVLGVFMGTVDIYLGGPTGTCVELTRGDVVIIPAGVAHKNINASDDFLCVGAYWNGAEYDILTGRAEERELAVKNIETVELPKSDPVFGAEGPLLECWKTISDPE